ncbi:hypothetical protein [Parvularcula oceani]|uniref:hypothetical protein n=1 Tax=Parvularcula oceani TaxID=1247963 RepID=UPI0012DDE235|nr:hypothetical protein [Parvularcula oceani]
MPKGPEDVPPKENAMGMTRRGSNEMAEGARPVIRARGLAAAERAMAASVFGAALDTASVRLKAGRLPFQPRGVVMAPWNGIYWGRPLPRDFTAAPPAIQALLLHELTHCAQYQAGMDLIARGAFAHGRAWLTGRSAYAYRVTEAPLGRRPFEHQAAIVEDAWRLLSGLPPRREGARLAPLLAALGHAEAEEVRASFSASVNFGAPPLLNTPLR